MRESTPQPDVFEMILDSMGGSPAQADAKLMLNNYEEPWQTPREEGELALDVADNGQEIVVISTMAGADTEKIEVYIHNDLLTIRGERNRPEGSHETLNFLHEECFWGPFSRTVVLPFDVNGHHAKAEFKNGVLIIKIKKRDSNQKIEIKVVED